MDPLTITFLVVAFFAAGMAAGIATERAQKHQER
jgi:hypothetical protein